MPQELKSMIKQSYLKHLLSELESKLSGELHYDSLHRIIYATDASAYRQKPLAVALPKTEADIQQLITFANRHQIGLIPRTAGTSLAGQVVGEGIVVDVSKYLNKIIEINAEEAWVRVQPGVVRDELNKAIEPYGLFFSPETSTSNRCMIGGMLGNNACGAHSLVYGSTREHTLEVKALLSDGSSATFGALSAEAFHTKRQENNLEGKLYQDIYELLSDESTQADIVAEFPEPSLARRNTGYALDMLLRNRVFKSDSDDDFNFCTLLAGSEGTLAFTTEIKLHLDPLPPPHKALVCVHLNSVEDALYANLIALRYQPVSIELMDKAIMDLTKTNKQQNANRFFVKGDPGAILIVEFAEEEAEYIFRKAEDMEQEMRQAGYGWHFPVVQGGNISKVWALRKAGLGVLSNMVGDAKPAPVIEDTAVLPKHLPSYIADIKAMLEAHNTSCVYYAHIATGELHLRPVLNLKEAAGVDKFYSIAKATAHLVKKYRGSLSGEHGDGRLRGEFIPIVLGEKNLALFKKVKNSWDPQHIFNPNKITDTPPMNTALRYSALPERPLNFPTLFHFAQGPGLVRSAERCNGAGDCRKTHIMGGTMCPSYQATRNERNTPRARANTLRELMSRSLSLKEAYSQQDIYEVLSLCLSCKACKSECPSNVDIAKLKAEYLQHYYDHNGLPLRNRMIAHITTINKIASLSPYLYNFLVKTSLSKIAMRLLGFAPQRQMPLLHRQSLGKWMQERKHTQSVPKAKVFFFKDEFTNYQDADVGIMAIQLLEALGYEVHIPPTVDSGRTFFSKGLLRRAKKCAEYNVALLHERISAEQPLIGIEPSTILTFRDEYPDIVNDSLRPAAHALAQHCLSIEEFIAREFEAGRISHTAFTSEVKHIKLHGHCQQKAICGTQAAITALSIPQNYKVEEIPSGCCGMAGSFGFEKEHYALSMQIGEMVLFPAVRAANADTIIAAAGTSCRHQIKEGTQTKALHPVQILWDALLSVK